MSSESMRRGAREANEESDRAAQARSLGEAIGGLAAFAVAINKLEARVAELEADVRDLKHEHRRYGNQP